MAQPSKRSQARPRTQPRQTARPVRGYQPTPPRRPARVWLGPLAVMGAIALLAIVALPAIGPAPASGTGQELGLAASPSTVPSSATANATSTAVETPPTPTTAPTQRTTVDSAYPRPVAQMRRRLDRVFRQLAKDVGAPGLVAAVKLPDGSVWYGARGVLWPGGPEATADSPFVWGSITKTFVAALTLRAATQQRLALDQTIDAWLPQIPGADRITVRMLLAHRSGLFDYFQHKDYPELVFERPGHAWTIEEILALRGPRVFAPGRGFSYSNTNYVLLGLILEQVTGQPLATLIRDQLLVPLGLDETVFQQAGQPVGLVGAKGFWKNSQGFREWSDGSDFRPTTSAATVAWAAGAMEGSVRDLLDWEMALYSGQVLTAEELALMLDIDKRSGYGLGARTQTVSGRDGYGHGGSLRGFVAVMYRLPVEDLDVVVLANVGFANLDRVADRLARAALNPLPTPQPSVPLVSPLPGPSG